MSMPKAERKERRVNLIRHLSTKKESIPKQAAQDADSALPEQEQRGEGTDEMPDDSGSWQTFQTP